MGLLMQVERARSKFSSQGGSVLPQYAAPCLESLPFWLQQKEVKMSPSECVCGALR